MRRCKWYLPVTALLGVSVAILPALASFATGPTIDAVNEGSPYISHLWVPAQASVAAGGAVRIRNSTELRHGVEWRSALKPSCEEGAGKVPVGRTREASATNWSGNCTFTLPGVYAFWCTVHGPEMNGTITVLGTPTATTEEPTETGQTGATLNGVVKPEGQATSYYFTYRPTLGPQQRTAVHRAGSGFASRSVSATVAGLSPGMEYRVELVATYGVNSTALGGEKAFVTPAASSPGVTTGSAAGVTQTGTQGGAGSSSGDPESAGRGRIAALITRQLASPRRTTIGMVLKRGSFTLPFTALEPGTAVIDWYYLPPGAKLAKHTKPKAVLIASGNLSFAAALTATIKVRLTAAGQGLFRHANRIALTARGAFTPTGHAPIIATRTFVLRRSRLPSPASRRAPLIPADSTALQRNGSGSTMRNMAFRRGGRLIPQIHEGANEIQRLVIARTLK